MSGKLGCSPVEKIGRKSINRYVVLVELIMPRTVIVNAKLAYLKAEQLIVKLVKFEALTFLIVGEPESRR